MCYNTLDGDCMYERLELLLSQEDLKQIKKKRILLVGIGGVGGACFEALVRLGYSFITVIDPDTFVYSNLNRQILSTLDNIGHFKAKEAVLRAKSINKDIFVDSKEIFLNEANINEIDFASFDYIIDCCDTVTTKILLVEKAIEYNKKIISSMGTGNRLDPTKLILTDIWKTSYDPLAKAVRNVLRKKSISYKLPVVASLEAPIKTKSRVVGSCVLVPSTAGLYLASYILKDTIKK